MGMPLTKQCPDCGVRVHIRQKVCEHCHHVFRAKRAPESKLQSVCAEGCALQCLSFHAAIDFDD